jgi:hypothetical protein
MSQNRAIAQIKKIKEITLRQPLSDYGRRLVDAIDETLAEHAAALDADAIATLDDLAELDDLFYKDVA